MKGHTHSTASGGTLESRAHARSLLGNTFLEEQRVQRRQGGRGGRGTPLGGASAERSPCGLSENQTTAKRRAAREPLLLLPCPRRTASSASREMASQWWQLTASSRSACSISAMTWTSCSSSTATTSWLAPSLLSVVFLLLLSRALTLFPFPQRRESLGTWATLSTLASSSAPIFTCTATAMAAHSTPMPSATSHALSSPTHFAEVPSCATCSSPASTMTPIPPPSSGSTTLLCFIV